MGFRITTGPHKVWQPVTLSHPNAEGVLQSTKVELLFEIVDDHVASDALVGSQPAYGSNTREDRERLVDFFAGVTHDWRSFEDPAGKPVEFDPSTLRQLLLYPWFSEPVMQAYGNARRGRKSGN